MSLTPQKVLRERMLLVLMGMPGGGARRREVLSAMDRDFSARWTPEDLESPNQHPGEPKWANRTSFERAVMVREGLLDKSANGRWVMTTMGWQAARDLASTDGAARSVPSVMRLADLTDSSAVDAAIAEFLALGREAFLAKYTLERSQDYFVRVEDHLLDSKPILSVAYSYQFPRRGALPVGSFSGGATGAVRTLRLLGFETVTRAQVDPPALGRGFASRTDLHGAFGGDRRASVVRFPGEEHLNLFVDEADQHKDAMLAPGEIVVHRVHELRGTDRLSQGANALLEQARLHRSLVRCWSRSSGGEVVFVRWLLPVGRTWVAGVDADGPPSPVVEWYLQPVLPGSELDAKTLQALREADATVDDDSSAPEAAQVTNYQELVARVEDRGQRRRDSGVSRIDFARSAAARRAVVIRSKGMCESSRCTGTPSERSRSGDPILDVDHIHDLALGGADHPSNMVALCPNCHACKTRGARQDLWRVELRAVALGAHHAAMRAESWD